MSPDALPLYASLDEAMIARCLSLAARGIGTVSPNPLVGAIVLDARGRKVGSGYHQKAGESHAEVLALDEAGERARGGTLYVNLEPCNHHGRTPPCTLRIIESGVQRVVCGTLDPNPLVAGSGRDALQNARISVRYGFLEEECRRLNEVFFHYISTRMPFVAVKLAMTADGKLGTRNGESRWITGPLARQMVHHLRQRYDAVLTTAETVITDDPLLTVREVPVVRKQPVRIVLDRRFRLNVDRYRLFKDASNEAPVWIITSKLSHDVRHAAKARQRGMEIIEVSETGGRLNLTEALQQLGEREITSVLVEAGGQLAGSLMQEALARKCYLFYGPKILPDRMAIPAFGSSVQLHLPAAPQLAIHRVQPIETDWLVEATPIKPAG